MDKNSATNSAIAVPAKRSRRQAFSVDGLTSCRPKSLPRQFATLFWTDTPSVNPSWSLTPHRSWSKFKSATNVEGHRISIFLWNWESLQGRPISPPPKKTHKRVWHPLDLRPTPSRCADSPGWETLVYQIVDVIEHSLFWELHGHSVLRTKLFASSQTRSASKRSFTILCYTNTWTTKHTVRRKNCTPFVFLQ